jgi:HK97 family phage major capsid protein
MAFRDISKMRQDLHAKVEACRAVLSEAEKRDDKKLTEEERTKVNGYRTEIANMEDEIKTEEILQRNEMRQSSANANDGGNTPGEFRNVGEFMIALANNRTAGMRFKESRDAVAGDGPSGGYLIPEQFGGMLREVAPGDALIRPRAQYLGGGTDAPVKFNSFDQSGSKGVYGGVTVSWVSEVGTRQDAGEPKFNQVTLEPKEVSGYIDISNKLLRNASEFNAFAERQIRLAKIGSEDQAFISGDGVGKPLGFIGHDSSLEIVRTTANSIVYDDIVNMYSRARFSSNMIWAANQTILPKLMKMKDEANQLIWQANARDGAPGSIFGIPVVYSDLLPVLGTKGDLVLCDFSYYGVRDGMDVAMFADPYSQAVNQVTRFYLFWLVDGQPMLRSPVLLRDGATTVSPFIVLE